MNMTIDQLIVALCDYRCRVGGDQPVMLASTPDRCVVEGAAELYSDPLCAAFVYQGHERSCVVLTAGANQGGEHATHN